MIIPLKLISCVWEREGTHTWLRRGKPKGAHSVPKCHPSFQTELNTSDCQEKGAKTIQVDLLYCLRKALAEVPRLMLRL